jgi:hypothetical protein
MTFEMGRLTKFRHFEAKFPQIRFSTHEIPRGISLALLLMDQRMSAETMSSREDLIMTERGSKIFGVIMAFAGGAIAGAATALLCAPMTGRDTRNQIKKLANETATAVKTKAGEIKLPLLSREVRNGAR